MIIIYFLLQLESIRELSYNFPMHHIHNSESRKRAVEDHSIFGNGTVFLVFLININRRC